MPVKVGPRGICQCTPCLWPDLGQEAVAARRFGQIPPFLLHCELLLMEIGMANAPGSAGFGLRLEAGGTALLVMH